jgi:hypothetical protein
MDGALPDIARPGKGRRITGPPRMARARLLQPGPESAPVRKNHRRRVERKIPGCRGRIVEASGHRKIYRWRGRQFCLQSSGADCGRQHRKSPQPHPEFAGAGGPAAGRPDPLGFSLPLCSGTQSAPFEFRFDGARGDDLFASKTALRSLPGSLILCRPGSGVTSQKKRTAKNREKN